MYFPEDMNFQYFFFDTYIAYFLQVCYSEFAACNGGEQFRSFFAATCAWQKIFCAEKVFFCPFMGDTMRVGAKCKFVKKGHLPFLTN